MLVERPGLATNEAFHDDPAAGRRPLRLSGAGLEMSQPADVMARRVYRCHLHLAMGVDDVEEDRPVPALKGLAPGDAAVMADAAKKAVEIAPNSIRRLMEPPCPGIEPIPAPPIGPVCSQSRSPDQPFEELGSIPLLRSAR